MRKLAFTLAEGATHVAMPKGSRRAAFTLAEVLITIAILGVVAALTLPAVINNIEHRELRTSLKAAYSILLQGLDRLNADAGYITAPKDYNTSSPGSFYKEYKNYFKLLYDCSARNPDESLCMSRASNKSEDIDFYNDLTYKTYTGGALYTLDFDDGQFVLQNGMLVMINNPENNSLVYISVDVNGKKKNPNKLGQDVFTFQLMSDGRLLPMGAEGTKYSEDEYCSKTSGSNRNGIACTNKALNDKDFFKNLPK